MGRKAVSTDHTKGAALSLPVWPPRQRSRAERSRRNLELEVLLGPQHPHRHLLGGPGVLSLPRHPGK